MILDAKGKPFTEPADVRRKRALAKAWMEYMRPSYLYRRFVLGNVRSVAAEVGTWETRRALEGEPKQLIRIRRGDL